METGASLRAKKSAGYGRRIFHTPLREKYFSAAAYTPPPKMDLKLFRRKAAKLMRGFFHIRPSSGRGREASSCQ